VKVTSRVFFALWPDDEVRGAIETLARDCVQRTGGRAPDPTNLHLTMAFIGEVPADGVRLLQETGKRASAGVSPFTLTLDRVGAFHKQEIAWVGTARANPPIEALADQLSTRLTAAGFALDRRPFHPHVTLARRARTRELAMQPGDLVTPIVWNVTALTLAASKHAQGALRYVAIDSWPLGERR
jgi:2'-5' RNA ligase